MIFFVVVIEDNYVIYRDFVDISVAVATPKVSWTLVLTLFLRWGFFLYFWEGVIISSKLSNY